MAFDAFVASLVGSVHDAYEFTAITVGVLEKCMTSKTERAVFIEREKFVRVRMIDGGPVAVFTLDGLMSRTIDLLQVFLVTLQARFPTLVLDRKILPVLNIAEAIKVVSEAVAMDAEIIRNHKLPGDENCRYECDGYPQWAQNVPLHLHLSCGSKQNAKGMRAIVTTVFFIDSIEDRAAIAQFVSPSVNEYGA